MTIVVTGATGNLGKHAVETLLAKGVPASEIVAVGRSVDKIADLASRGVNVKQASYDDPASLDAAFAGADKVLLVSASDPGVRIPQHTNVIEAAKRAGVRLLAYTSYPKVDTAKAHLSGDHKATEQIIKDSGLPYVILRNAWYLENYPLESALEHGMFGAAADGKVSIAPRSDYAEAAAGALLANDGSENKVYELGGEAVTMAELAAIVAKVSGKPVTYTDLGEEKYAEMLVGVGLPAEGAKVIANADAEAAHGELHVPLDDIELLLGRPVTPLETAVRDRLG